MYCVCHVSQCMTSVSSWGMPVFTLAKASNDRPLTAVVFTILHQVTELCIPTCCAVYSDVTNTAVCYIPSYIG